MTIREETTEMRQPRKIINLRNLLIAGGALLVGSMIYTGIEQSKTLDGQLKLRGYKLAYKMPRDVVNETAKGLFEYDKTAREIEKLFGLRPIDSDKKILQALRESNRRLEDTFRTNIKIAYDTVVAPGYLSPLEFIHGVDQNEDMRITPDEFNYYLTKLPSIIKKKHIP